jgi:hypothetical protein
VVGPEASCCSFMDKGRTLTPTLILLSIC